MKKFLIFVMICIVVLGIGFTTIRFSVKQQTVRIDTTPIECNEGDSFTLDIEVKNKKEGTVVTATSDNENIVALSNTAGSEYKFEAKNGGKATITVSSNISGFVSQTISVTVGDGSSTSLPLCISSVEQYKRIGAEDEQIYTLNKCYKLVADLDFDGDYIVLGEFSGQFDYNNHRLNNVAVETSDLTKVGLFSTLKSTAVVKNLVLSEFRATGATKVGEVNIGAIAGVNYGTIRDIEIANVIIEDASANAVLGGVAGINYGTIRRVDANMVAINTDTTASTAGDNSIVGGIVGLNSTQSASIFACAVKPVVKGGKYVGGVAGQNDSANIENCAVGELSTSYTVSGTLATSYVGGIVGYNVATTAKASVSDCYALVGVGTIGNRGAVVGKNENATIGGAKVENPIFGCYYNQGISGSGTVAFAEKGDYLNGSQYAIYVFEKTEEQLKSGADIYVSYVTDEDENVLWQFDSVWFVEANNVPQLMMGSTAGVSRISVFMAENGNPGEINSNKSGDQINADTDYRITDDITITSPIPTYNAVMEGVKDDEGNYPTVTFEYNNFDGDWAALFGSLGKNAHIKNLNFNIRITCTNENNVQYYAHLVAHNEGEVNNCVILNTSLVEVTNVPNKSLYVGGIAAENKGQVLNSNNLGSISLKTTSAAESYVGGIVGKSAEYSNISKVNNGENNTTSTITVERAIIGYVGGIVGYSNSNVLNAINYESITVEANSRDESTAVAGVVGKIEGRALKVYQSANFGNVTSKNVAGVVGITSSDANASNTDVQISECMSNASLTGLRVGGIVYLGNCGLIQNCLSQNQIKGAAGEEDASVVAGLIYKMNVTENGRTRAYNCVSNCTFGVAGNKFYEDANQAVMGTGNVASLLRGGYYGAPISCWGCVDKYALLNCYAINNGDESVRRTNGMSFLTDGFWEKNMAINEKVYAKEDHLIQINDGNAVQEMKTNTTEHLLENRKGFKLAAWFIETGENVEELQVSPFSSDIWNIQIGSITLKAFAN